MLVFTQESHMIAFPMLLRNLDIPGKAYRDAGCVHGFVGPLTTSGEIPEQVRRHFIESLQEFYISQNVISAFSRLHPLIDRSTLLSGYGNVIDVGATLSIDLTPPPEEQLSRYRRNHRQDINRLKNAGYTCRRVGPKYLGDFLRIYLDTMDRIQADSMYYYDNDYFEYLLREMKDVIHLFVCELDGCIASVALCAFCNGIIQVHLAGTDAEHKKFAPMKLVFDTIREWGNKNGANVVHLGGGVGARRDSLYNFKKGFGANEHTYRIWQHIVDPDVYETLCSQAFDESRIEPSVDYFPKYRNPCLRGIGLRS